MSPKLARRLRNWVDKRLNRGRRRNGAVFSCISANTPQNVTLTPECGMCGRHECNCLSAVQLTRQRAPSRRAPSLFGERCRVLLTPGSCPSISSPESAYFTGYSEDAATPLTPLTTTSVGVGKCFMLKNRDFLPDTSTTLAATRSNDNSMLMSTGDSGCFPQQVAGTPEMMHRQHSRLRSGIKTNPWVRTPSKLACTEQTNERTENLPTVSSACLRRSVCYSSGRGSFVSDVSTGESLQHSLGPPLDGETSVCEPMYATLTPGARARRSVATNSSSSSDESGSSLVPRCAAVHGRDSYSSDDTANEQDAVVGDRNLPSTRKKLRRSGIGRVRLRRCRKRGAREQARVEVLPLETVWSPPTPIRHSPAAVMDATAVLHTYENVGPMIQQHAPVQWRPAHLMPPAFCPASEPLRRKHFVDRLRQEYGLKVARDQCSPRRSLIHRERGRPRSSLSSHIAAGDDVCGLAAIKPLYTVESVSQHVEKLRRQRAVADMRLASSRLDDQHLNYLRRLAAENLHYKRVQLTSAGCQIAQQPRNIASASAQSRTYLV